MMRIAGTVAVLLAFIASCAGAGDGPAAIVRAPGPTQDRLAFWQGVRARGDAPPEGADVQELALELVGYLGSTDPGVRDRLAYEVLAGWIGRQRRLSRDTVRRIAAVLLGRLRDPVGVTVDDAVFGRSFAALVLAEIAARDVEEPLWDDSELTGAVETARSYALREQDLRGYVEGRGWAHAAAHTADWLAALARHPRLGRERGQLVLDAVLDLAVRRHGQILCHGEDARLAQPVLEVLGRDHVDGEAFSSWLTRLLAPLGEKGGARFDRRLYAAQRNARNLAFTLFVRLSLMDERSAAQTAALAALTGALRG